MITKKTRQFFEERKGVFYHEVGHLLGYVLSNTDQSTDLGEVLSLEIGLEKACVTPKLKYYHFNKNEEERRRVRENTKNIPRTIAWYVEVILGCSFQCVYESQNFYDCFGLEKLSDGRYKNGYSDCSNISAVNNISAYRYDRQFFYSLKDSVDEFIKKNQLVDKLETVVNTIIEKNFNSNNYQLSYEGRDLRILKDAIFLILEEDNIFEYHKIILYHTNLLIQIKD